MNKIEELYAKDPSPVAYVKGYLAHLTQVISALDHVAIVGLIDTLIDARKNGKTVFFIGNGGSAATASHFMNDLSVGTRPSGKPFKVVSLTDNNAVMTAIANDFGYDSLFSKQLESQYVDGDVLVAISASGNSENLLQAVEYVKSRGGKTIGLTGFDGGKLKKAVDHYLHVQTEKGEYGPVEDVHMIFDHVIGTYLMFMCRAELNA